MGRRNGDVLKPVINKTCIHIHPKTLKENQIRSEL